MEIEPTFPVMNQIEIEPAFPVMKGDCSAGAATGKAAAPEVGCTGVGGSMPLDTDGSTLVQSG